MGLTKKEIYTPEQNSLAAIAKALGHPARIAILQQLLREETCICRDLTSEIQLAQPTISRHLQELKKVGIIQGTIEGTQVNYCIDPVRWGEIRGVLLELFSGLKGCC